MATHEAPLSSSFWVKTVAGYKSQKPEEISFKKNQKIHVTEEDTANFRFFGTLDGKQGWFSCKYAKKIEEVMKEPKVASRFSRRSKRSKPSVEPKEEDVSGVRTRGTSIWRENVFAKKLNTSTPPPRKESEAIQNVIKMGLLERRSTEAKAVKRSSYWAVLRTDELAFFRSAGVKKPLLKIITKQISKLAEVKYDSENFFWFALHTGRKKYLLGTNTFEDRETWIQLITLSSSGVSTAGVLAESQKALSESKRMPTSPVVAPRLSRMSRMEVIKKGKGNLFQQLKHMDSNMREVSLRSDGKAGKSDRPRGIRASMAISMDFENEKEISKDEEAREERAEQRSLSLPSPIGFVQAIKEYYSDSVERLTFREFDIFALLEKTEKDGWWLGEYNGSAGYFPSSYVRIVKENRPQANKRGNRFRAKILASDLVGTFTLGDIIGQVPWGGIKYTATHIIKKTSAAILQYPSETFSKAEKNQIIRKINNLAALSHPNIVAHRGVILSDKYFNIVTHYVGGESLEEKLQRFGCFKEDQLVTHIRPVLDVLKYLHSNEIIHGQVQASNILVQKVSGKVFLGDLGFIKILSPSSHRRTILAPYWSAPEVLHQQHISPGLDVWALGCTVVELLTGNPPLSHLSVMEASFAMAEIDPNELIPDTVSEPMKEFLSKCFNKEWHCRATPRELLNLSLFQVDKENEMGEEEEEKEEEEMEEEGEQVEKSDFEKAEQIINELLGWFTEAMDTENVSHAIQIRKAIRDKRTELIDFKEDTQYDDLRSKLRAAMHRCEDHFGEFIPLDSVDCEYSDDYSEFSDEFADEDDCFF